MNITEEQLDEFFRELQKARVLEFEKEPSDEFQQNKMRVKGEIEALLFEKVPHKLSEFGEKVARKAVGITPGGIYKINTAQYLLKQCDIPMLTCDIPMFTDEDFCQAQKDYIFGPIYQRVLYDRAPFYNFVAGDNGVSYVSSKYLNLSHTPASFPAGFAKVLAAWLFINETDINCGNILSINNGYGPVWAKIDHGRSGYDYPDFNAFIESLCSGKEIFKNVAKLEELIETFKQIILISDEEIYGMIYPRLYLLIKAGLSKVENSPQKNQNICDKSHAETKAICNILNKNKEFCKQYVDIVTQFANKHNVSLQDIEDILGLVCLAVNSSHQDIDTLFLEAKQGRVAPQLGADQRDLCWKEMKMVQDIQDRLARQNEKDKQEIIDAVRMGQSQQAYDVLSRIMEQDLTTPNIFFGEYKCNIDRIIQYIASETITVADVENWYSKSLLQLDGFGDVLNIVIQYNYKLSDLPRAALRHGGTSDNIVNILKDAYAHSIPLSAIHPKAWKYGIDKFLELTNLSKKHNVDLFKCLNIWECEANISEVIDLALGRGMRIQNIWWNEAEEMLYNAKSILHRAFNVPIKEINVAMCNADISFIEKISQKCKEIIVPFSALKSGKLWQSCVDENEFTQILEKFHDMTLGNADAVLDDQMYDSIYNQIHEFD